MRLDRSITWNALGIASFAFLSFVETLIFIRILGLDGFGTYVMVLAASQLMLGVFDIRVGEILVTSRRGKTSHNLSLMIVYEFACALLISVVIAAISPIAFGLNWKDALFYSGFSLAPQILTTGYRFACDDTRINVIFRALPLALRVALTVSLIMFMLIGYSSFSPYDSSIWCGVLVLGALLNISFVNLRSQKLDNRYSNSIDGQISSNFVSSLSSLIYRNLDLILIGFAYGQGSVATLRLWSFILSPLAMVADLKLQVVLSNRERMSLINQIMVLFVGILGSLTVVMFLQMSDIEVTNHLIIGLFMLPQYGLSFLMMTYRAELTLFGAYRYLASMGVLAAVMYLLMLSVSLWFSVGVALAVLLKTIVNLAIFRLIKKRWQIKSISFTQAD